MYRSTQHIFQFFSLSPESQPTVMVLSHGIRRTIDGIHHIIYNDFPSFALCIESSSFDNIDVDFTSTTSQSAMLKTPCERALSLWPSLAHKT